MKNLLQGHNRSLAAAAAACLVLALYRTYAPTKTPLRITLAPEFPRDSDGDDSKKFPYSPNSLPGGRDVITPYGVLRVYEWGPEHGLKVLLLSGMSTPAIALTDLADGLVQRGSRVIVFDYFGRGFSDAPMNVDHDTALYVSQILLVLGSSEISWTGRRAFHIIGYSFGGGLAMALVSHFPDLAISVTLVAPCGLIRKYHVSWQARLLYQDGWLPEWLRWALVRRRVWVSPLVPQPAHIAATPSAGKSDATGGPSYDYALISPKYPGVTVADVLNWQTANHPGFIGAFISCMNHAPIFMQTDIWNSVGETMLRQRRLEPEDSTGGKILLILGASDPGIVKTELIPDATLVLGEDGFEPVILDGGHEIAITQGLHIAKIAAAFWTNSD